MNKQPHQKVEHAVMPFVMACYAILNTALTSLRFADHKIRAQPQILVWLIWKMENHRLSLEITREKQNRKFWPWNFGDETEKICW